MLYSRRSWVALGVWLRYGLVPRPSVADADGAARRVDGEPGHEGLHPAPNSTRLFAGFSEVARTSGS